MPIVNNIQYFHEINNNDPIVLKSYIDSRIEITMQNRSIHQGILYTVDPISESFVLVERENEGFRIKVIVAQSIKEVRLISSQGTTVPQLFLNQHHQLTESELVIKKMKIKKLFIDNRFTVTENDGIVEVGGMLFIEPPYQMENCICTNPIILSRVQNVMSQVAIE